MVKKIQQDFKDKTALITGGARNIGLAIARDLASRGASVAIVDICNELDTIHYRLSTKADLDRAVADSALKLAWRKLKNGIRFRFQHFAGKPRMPQAFSLDKYL